MDKIISAKDICERDGARTYRQWIVKCSRAYGKIYNGRVEGLAVQAVIEGGRWIAHCNAPRCNGCEYVRSDEPIFFCLSCGNAINGGSARPVVFPEEREAIEAALVERPLILAPALTEIAAVMYAKPEIAGLTRYWDPSMTAKDLKKQNESAGIL